MATSGKTFIMLLAPLVASVVFTRFGDREDMVRPLALPNVVVMSLALGAAARVADETEFAPFI